jgi:malate dehydrogenase
MRSVAIIGAGDLGATIARTLASRDSIPRIRLIDEAADVAAGKTLDISQSAPIERFHTRVEASPDVHAAAGADVIVIADRATGGGGEWTGEAGLALLKQLSRLGAASTFVLSGATQSIVVDRAVVEIGLPRERVLASAPHALVSALRAMIALEAGASPSDVSVSVLGVPPDRLVVPWHDGSIAGTPMSHALDAPALDRLRRRLPALWPPGPYALASAVRPIVEALTHGSSRRFTCHVVLDGELGMRRLGTAFTVQLGPGGVARYCLPALDPRERVLFENAVG